MTTTWNATPVFSYWSINELRDAIYLAGGSPPVWTGGSALPPNTTLTRVHLTEVQEAIQRLWDDRGLGLVPNWTGQADPNAPRTSHITDLRNWFNHYETWGDLRGVHWFDSSRSDFTGIFWNVETVIGVTKDNAYHRTLVEQTYRDCVAARNYGLVNIVRIDWKEGYAVPTVEAEYGDWITNFTTAVNTLKDVATIFIVGNEPTIEPWGDPHRGITSGQYADAFNRLYAKKVPGVMYLAAGPAAWSEATPMGQASEIDIPWLRSASSKIRGLDGWALHTYGSPYLRNAAGGAPCNTATVNCPLPSSSNLTGDASFRRYEDYIREIKTNWPRKPVYITETNTQGHAADIYDSEGDGPPAHNYVTGWIQSTYEEIRRFNNEHNSDRSEWPRILCLCWFVDSYRGNTKWMDFALTNGREDKLVQARKDLRASNTSTGISPGNPTSNLAPWLPIVEHRTGISILSGTVS